MILSIGTDRPKQTVQTQIILVLKSTLTRQYYPNSRRAKLSADSSCWYQWSLISGICSWPTLFAKITFGDAEHWLGVNTLNSRLNYSEYFSFVKVTFKVPNKIQAEDSLFFLLKFFRENMGWHFMWIKPWKIKPYFLWIIIAVETAS